MKHEKLCKFIDNMFVELSPNECDELVDFILNNYKKCPYCGCVFETTNDGKFCKAQCHVMDQKIELKQKTKRKII